MPIPPASRHSFPDAQAMQQKFLTLARPVLNGRADQLADAILSLERFDRVEKADAARTAIGILRSVVAAGRDQSSAAQLSRARHPDIGDMAEQFDLALLFGAKPPRHAL